MFVKCLAIHPYTPAIKQLSKVSNSGFVMLDIFTSDVCVDMPNDAYSHVKLQGSACGPLPRGYQLSLFSGGFPIFSHKKFIIVDAFYCFLIMSEDAVVTTTAPETVVCCTASPITMTVTMASTSVGLIASD